MFSYNQSHELKASSKCTRCGQDFVRLTPDRAQTQPHEEVRYYIQCKSCKRFRYGIEAWDIKSALAIIGNESLQVSNASAQIDDEPLDLSIRHSDTSLVERMEARLPSTSSTTSSQRSYSPQAGTSSGLPGLGMRQFRPDLIYTTDSDNDETLSPQVRKISKRFTNKSQLATYQRPDMDERPYQCEFCNRRFAVKSNLTAHRRIHTGEKPYQCGTCKRFFTRSTGVKKHRCAYIGGPPYKCGLCGKIFLLRYDLMRHHLYPC